MKKKSQKLTTKLDSLCRSIKNEIVSIVNEYGGYGALVMPNIHPKKSVTLSGYTYDIDRVIIGWEGTDYTITIKSNGLGYPCNTAEGLIELLQALEETFNS
jgi:hypothetical protein